MFISIDFNSDEAIYMQLCDQIIRAIAIQELREGESLPSVRQMADEIGINMHTVNKAYAILRKDGFLKLDRRSGAMIAIDLDKIKALSELDESLRPVIARAICKDVSKEEAIAMVEKIYKEYGGSID